MEKNKLVVTYIHEDIEDIDPNKKDLFTNIGNKQIVFLQSKHIYDAGIEYSGILPFDIPNLMNLCMEHYIDLINPITTLVTGLPNTKMDHFRVDLIKKFIKRDQITSKGKVIDHNGVEKELSETLGAINPNYKNINYDISMIHSSPTLMNKYYKFFSVTSEYDTMDKSLEKIKKRGRNHKKVVKNHYLKGDVYVRNPILKIGRLNTTKQNNIWIGAKITCYFIVYTGKGYDKGIVIPEFVCGEHYGELAHKDDKYSDYQPVGEVLMWDGKYGTDDLLEYREIGKRVNEKSINREGDSELKINIYYN